MFASTIEPALIPDRVGSRVNEICGWMSFLLSCNSRNSWFVFGWARNRLSLIPEFEQVGLFVLVCVGEGFDNLFGFGAGHVLGLAHKAGRAPEV